MSCNIPLPSNLNVWKPKSLRFSGPEIIFVQFPRGDLCLQTNWPATTYVGLNSELQWLPTYDICAITEKNMKVV